jgi:hypothetical protein
MVPKEIEREFTQTVYKTVTDEQVVTYTELVPETIERTVQIPVTTMVAQEVTYEVPGEPLRR